MSQITRPKPYPHARQAYRLGILNGVLFNIGVAFVDPGTVLPVFIATVSKSDVAVGLVSAIASGGWSLPQLLGARYIQHQPLKRPMYVLTTCLRIAAWVIVLPITYFLAGPLPALALAGFILCYALDAFSGGMAGPAFLDIVAKTVSPNRLGAFFANRVFWGGVGAIGAGMLVRVILSDRGPSFPANYTLLFALALAMFVPGWIAFMRIKEPPGKAAEAQSLREFLRGAPAIIRQNREYRLLLIGRMLLGAMVLAFPFYIIYCRRELGVPDSAVGTYLSIQMAGAVVSNPLWALLSDRRGPRALIIATTVAAVIYSAISLAATFIPHSPWLGRAAFGAVFFLLSASGSGGWIGCTNYLLAIAPEEQRPIYIGVQNTFFAITMFLPMLGGAVLRFGSFHLLFGIATAFAVAGMVVVLKLPAIPPAGPA